MFDSAVTETEVAWVLVQDRRENAVADDGAVESVEIGSSGALSIAFNAPAESCVFVESFMLSGNDKCDPKGDWIGGGTEGKLHFLAARQRDGVSAIGNVEGGQDSESALLLLLLDLLVRLLLLSLEIGRASCRE